MICSRCQTAYLDADESAATRASLLGICPACRGEPSLRPFALSFASGAFAGVLILELLVLLLLAGGLYAALVPPLVIALVCASVYGFAARSARVEYSDEAHKKRATVAQRLAGWFLGFLLGLIVLFGTLGWISGS